LLNGCVGENEDGSAEVLAIRLINPPARRVETRTLKLFIRALGNSQSLSEIPA
jgi:hypothetical protein